MDFHTFAVYVFGFALGMLAEAKASSRTHAAKRQAATNVGKS